MTPPGFPRAGEGFPRGPFWDPLLDPFWGHFLVPLLVTFFDHFLVPLFDHLLGALFGHFSGGPNKTNYGGRTEIRLIMAVGPK